MTITDWIGFTGVAIILIAYFLNLTNRLDKNSLIYILMNLIGGALACFASILLKYIPFIILEGSWTVVSIFGLINYVKKIKN